LADTLQPRRQAMAFNGLTKGPTKKLPPRDARAEWEEVMAAVDGSSGRTETPFERARRREFETIMRRVEKRGR